MNNDEHARHHSDLAELIGDPNLLLNDVFQSLEQLKIEPSKLYLDHIGYRSSSAQEYVRLCNTLKVNGVAKLVSEDIVRGRRIAVFELLQPISFNGFAIDCLEIIEPKSGDVREFKHQLDHAEFVLTEESLEEFVEKNGSVPFQTNDIYREGNPEVRIILPSGRAIGFHTIALVVYVSK